MLQKLVGLGTVLMPAVVLSITSDAHNVYNRLVQCYYRVYHPIVDAKATAMSKDHAVLKRGSHNSCPQ